MWAKCATSSVHILFTDIFPGPDIILFTSFFRSFVLNSVSAFCRFVFVFCQLCDPVIWLGRFGVSFICFNGRSAINNNNFWNTAEQYLVQRIWHIRICLGPFLITGMWVVGVIILFCSPRVFCSFVRFLCVCPVLAMRVECRTLFWSQINNVSVSIHTIHTSINIVEIELLW